MKLVAERVVQGCLILAGLIHLMPAVGVVGSSRLTALYGIPIDGPDLAILMRHRAVLFGILGLVMFAGAMRAGLRSAAILVGLASVASFLALAATTGQYNAQLGKVVAVDVAALVLLLAAAILHALPRGSRGQDREQVSAVLSTPQRAAQQGVPPDKGTSLE